jgi:NADH-quinone oxidoreductase subunit N
MPAFNLIAILPEIILTLCACTVFAVDPFVSREKKHLLGFFSLGALVLTGLALIPLSGSNLTAFSGMILLDAYAIFFKWLLLITSAIVVAMSILYIQIERINIGEYYGLILFATVGMLLLPGASDILSIYLSLELMSMSFYILTAFMRKSPRSVEAGIKYFLTGIFTSGIILYGAAFLYGLTGTTHLGSIRAYLSNTAPSPTLILAMVLLLAGFGFKIAAIPFHMWAPDVYDGAPTPITSLLSTGSKIAALAAMVRFFVSLPIAHPNMWQIFWIISVLTMTVGNVAALLQTNVKRLLAYSSVAQTGYLLIGLVVPSEEGLSAILIYSVAYAFMTLGAFATLVLLCKKDRRGDQISDFTGFAHLHPAVAAAFVVFALSLVGIPPTAGFIGKLFLFQAAIAHEFYWLAIFGILNSAISLYYYFKIIVAMYMENPSGEIAPSFSKPLTASLVITSLATLAIGLYPEPLIRAALASILVLR